MHKPLFFLFLFTVCNGSGYSQKYTPPADHTDRILSFHSLIDVQTDGKLLVTEDITVFNGDGETSISQEGESYLSLNNDIQRGILRDFPTRYEDSSGYFTNTGFVLKAVLKNGVEEPYVTENLNNGVRIKIGDKDIILAQGVYVYQIVYETNRQIIFHTDKDELYWNVNGSGWVFTADTVTCTIHFPEGAVIQEEACYTGVEGSTENNCSATLTGSSVYFTTIGKLQQYEGLTVAAAIQKGILHAPTGIKNTASFLRSNYIIPLLPLFVLALFCYYYIVWYRKGRDPKKGVIYPRFSPPPGLSPADCGYILEQKYGSHLFAAALVDCAVKKQLSIVITREGLIIKSNVYNFNRPAEVHEISPSSFSTYGFDVKTLYGQKAQRGHYNSTLGGCYEALSLALNDRFLIRRGKKNKMPGMFSLNKVYTQVGLGILILAILLSLQFIFSHLSAKLAVITIVLLVILFVIHFIFTRIMSAYTLQGRETADHLLGFRMYLETAEKQVYDQLTPPEKTLDLFEKYLPYAIALEVDNEWAEKFEGIMQQALQQGYQPAYYSMSGGHFSSFSMNDMSKGISSGLSSTVSSASSPPSSSSGGSGGGGSSGGGGGGGGGGGW